MYPSFTKSNILQRMTRILSILNTEIHTQPNKNDKESGATINTGTCLKLSTNVEKENGSHLKHIFKTRYICTCTKGMQLTQEKNSFQRSFILFLDYSAYRSVPVLFHHKKNTMYSVYYKIKSLSKSLLVSDSDFKASSFGLIV